MRRLVIVVPLLLVAAVGWAVYTLRIDAIRVTGTRTLSPEIVRRASGLELGERILWARLSPATRRIEALPQVASASVTRSLPHTVVITVHERAPVARLGGRPGIATDASGRAFTITNDVKLPTLAGWKGTGKPGSTLDTPSRFVLYNYARFPSVLRTKTVKIAVGPPFVLVFSDTTRIIFGQLIDLDAKARAAKTVLHLERGKKLSYVDVRAPTVPVSRPRAPKTPLPSPAQSQPNSQPTASLPAHSPQP